MDKRFFQSPLGLGIITISVVLLVMTLACFAMLTLSSARADYAFSLRNADTVAEYYAADAQAAEDIASFLQSRKLELTEEIPVGSYSVLKLHVRRMDDGTANILCWALIAAESNPYSEETDLNLWTGTPDNNFPLGN